MRYYTIKPMNGVTTFKCTFCEHSVTTLDFNSTHGNRRTQAAAAINQHAALSHLRTVSGNQVDWSWRTLKSPQFTHGAVASPRS
jgi:hypothetical protein